MTNYSKEAIMSNRGFWFLIVVGTCLVFWVGVFTTAVLFKGA